ncbi:MAG: FtsH protease activity modulator HflK [Reyranellaceae bacterium]
MPWNDKSGGGGPWGSGGGNGGGPWGGGNNSGGGGGNRGGGFGGGPRPPDLEELLRKGQDRMRNVLPGGFMSRRGIVLVVLVLVVAWLASGLYRVQTNEQGLELVLGKYSSTTGEGLNFNWPSPIGDVEVVNVTTQRTLPLGYEPTTMSVRSVNVAVQRERGSLMLTADENIIDIQFNVVWLVKNAFDFAFNIRNPEEAVRSAAEAAMREVVGKIELQVALTQGRAAIESETAQQIQRILDSYKSGIQVLNIQLLPVNPPASVIAAFNDVQAARQDKERAINEAQAYRNEVIPRAKGESERLVQQGEAYRTEVVNRAQGDAQRFISVYNQYAQAKDVTMERIYIETMEEVLRNVNKVLIDKSAGGSGVVPYLPLPALRNAPPANAAPAPAQGGTR